MHAQAHNSPAGDFCLDFSVPLELQADGTRKPIFEQGVFELQPVRPLGEWKGRSIPPDERLDLMETAKAAVEHAEPRIEKLSADINIEMERHDIANEQNLGAITIAGDEFSVWMLGSADHINLRGHVSIPKDVESNQYFYGNNYHFERGEWRPDKPIEFQRIFNVEYSTKPHDLHVQQKRYLIEREAPIVLADNHLRFIEREAHIIERLNALSRKEHELYVAHSNERLSAIMARALEIKSRYRSGEQMGVGY